jgi:histo-blood group ABO system transferase
MKIGLLLISTGKYHQFIEPLINSARKYFLSGLGYDITFFLFTDADRQNFENQNDVIYTHKLHEPWPFPTLKRYETFHKNNHLFLEQDYLFYCDIDMLFVDHVGPEILSDRVATTHPGFLGKRGTPETRKESLACVFPHEKISYFAGGFNGGKTEEFLKMSEIISHNIQKDLDNDVIAIWHDESHLNRYFIDNPPTNVLSPSYCYPESWQLPFQKRLLALDKNHKEIRG